MRNMRVAVIGVGRLGRKCVEAVSADHTTELAGVVRRPESAPSSGVKVPAVTHISELNQVDAALICVPVDAVAGIAQGPLQSRAGADEPGQAARMMLAAARDLPFLQAGAYFLLDLPPGRAVGGTASRRGKGMDLTIFMCR